MADWLTDNAIAMIWLGSAKKVIKPTRNWNGKVEIQDSVDDGWRRCLPVVDEHRVAWTAVFRQLAVARAWRDLQGLNKFLIWKWWTLSPLWWRLLLKMLQGKMFHRQDVQLFTYHGQLDRMEGVAREDLRVEAGVDHCCLNWFKCTTNIVLVSLSFQNWCIKLAYHHYTTVVQRQFLSDPSPIIADVDAEECVDDSLFGRDF